MESVIESDLIVVGGGPGGATLAAVVAKQGHRVLVLEKEQFPRYQIGESLIPATVHGICRFLGIWDEVVENGGFVRKNGAVFRWGKTDDLWVIGFSQARQLNARGVNFALQVERSKFDNILLRNAEREGAIVKEKANVDRLLIEDGRVVGVIFTDAEGKKHTARARFVADASGSHSRIYKHVGERVFSEFFRNVALFCYYENGERLPAPDEGNVLSEAFEKGWLWYIPLGLTPPNLTSVGAVIGPEHLQALQDEPEKAMDSFIAACPRIKNMLKNARRVTTGEYGQFRVRKDWSYTNERLWKPGMFLVGDAACFLDPVLSTGVHLSTYSALLAGRSVNSILGEGLDETLAFNEFEKRYRVEYETFYKFLLTFYDMHMEAGSQFWGARKVADTVERGNEAFVRLVAGNDTPSEVFLNANSGAGEKLQMLAEKLVNVELDKRAEVTEVMAKDLVPATPGKARPHHVALEDLRRFTWGAGENGMGPNYESGLQPSADGYRWVNA